jgi:hypothetical protein
LFFQQIPTKQTLQTGVPPTAVVGINFDRLTKHGNKRVYGR